MVVLPNRVPRSIDRRGRAPAPRAEAVVDRVDVAIGGVASAFEVTVEPAAFQVIASDEDVMNGYLPTRTGPAAVALPDDKATVMIGDKVKNKEVNPPSMCGIAAGSRRFSRTYETAR